MKSYYTCLLLAVLFASCHAFCPPSPTQQSSTTVALGMTKLTYRGKSRDFKAGSPLGKAAAGLGIKPKYNCKKGDCASCTLTVGGQRIKACIGKVPPEPKLKSLQEKGLAIS